MTTFVETFCSYCNSSLSRTSSDLRRYKRFFCNKEHKGLFDRGHNYGDTVPIFSKKKYRAVISCQKCGKLRYPKNIKEGLCFHCFDKKRKIKKWLSGDNASSQVGLAKEAAYFVKDYLIELYGDKCFVCKESFFRTNGTTIIQLNHIDGNYLNNSLKNLELLCPNHHAMTETWGSKNGHKGRRVALREFSNERLINDATNIKK